MNRKTLYILSSAALLACVPAMATRSGEFHGVYVEAMATFQQAASVRSTNQILYSQEEIHAMPNGGIFREGRYFMDGEAGERIDVFCSTHTAKANGNIYLNATRVELAAESAGEMEKPGDCQGKNSRPAVQMSLSDKPEKNGLRMGAAMEVSRSEGKNGEKEPFQVAHAAPISVRVVYQ